MCGASSGGNITQCDVVDLLACHSSSTGPLGKCSDPRYCMKATPSPSSGFPCKYAIYPLPSSPSQDVLFVFQYLSCSLSIPRIAFPRLPSPTSLLLHLHDQTNKRWSSKTKQKGNKTLIRDNSSQWQPQPRSTTMASIRTLTSKITLLAPTDKFQSREITLTTMEEILSHT